MESNNKKIKTGGRKKGTPKKTLCFEEKLKKSNLDIIEQLAETQLL